LLALAFPVELPLEGLLELLLPEGLPELTLELEPPPPRPPPPPPPFASATWAASKIAVSIAIAATTTSASDVMVPLERLLYKLRLRSSFGF